MEVSWCADGLQWWILKGRSRIYWRLARKLRPWRCCCIILPDWCFLNQTAGGRQERCGHPLGCFMVCLCFYPPQPSSRVETRPGWNGEMRISSIFSQLATHWDTPAKTRLDTLWVWWWWWCYKSVLSSLTINSPRWSPPSTLHPAWLQLSQTISQFNLGETPGVFYSSGAARRCPLPI